MIHPEFHGATWRTSSYSNTNGNCVQVAPGPALVGVRDSKAPDDGVLTISPERWSAFVWALAHHDLRR